MLTHSFKLEDLNHYSLPFKRLKEDKQYSPIPEVISKKTCVYISMKSFYQD